MIAFPISEHPLSSPLDLFDKSHFSAWRWRWEEKFVMICFITFCWLTRGSDWKRLQSIFCNRQDYRRTCFKLPSHFQMVFVLFFIFHSIASSLQSKLWWLFWQGKRKFSRRLESKKRNHCITRTHMVLRYLLDCRQLEAFREQTAAQGTCNEDGILQLQLYCPLCLWCFTQNQLK